MPVFTTLKDVAAEMRLKADILENLARDTSDYDFQLERWTERDTWKAAAEMLEEFITKESKCQTSAQIERP